MIVKLLEHTPNIEQLISTSAKLCYSNSNIEDLFEKQSPEKVEEFLNKLMSYSHLSPLEHATFTFAIEGVSRSLTHQLVRHRIASYSQQSQRYVKLNQFEYIVPPSIENNEKAKVIFIDSMQQSQKAYDEIVNYLMIKEIMDYCIKSNKMYPRSSNDSFLQWFKEEDKNKYLQIEKTALEDARYVFPNACETKIIVTFNIRSLLNFLEHRCCSRAQWEIRDLAEKMLRLVKPLAPNIFKKSGPPCLKGRCSEGLMTCGEMAQMKQKYLTE